MTPWMEWFLDCLSQAIEGAKKTLESVLAKARVWESLARVSLNDGNG